MTRRDFPPLHSLAHVMKSLTDVVIVWRRLCRSATDQHAAISLETTRRSKGDVLNYCQRLQCPQRPDSGVQKSLRGKALTCAQSAAGLRKNKLRITATVVIYILWYDIWMSTTNPLRAFTYCEKHGEIIYTSVDVHGDNTPVCFVFYFLFFFSNTQLTILF